IVADGFVHRDEVNAKQRMRSWVSGFGCPSLATIGSFTTTMEKLGFQNVSKTDITTHVLPSSKRLYYISFLGIPFYTVLQWLGRGAPAKKANLVAARDQYITLS